MSTQTIVYAFAETEEHSYILIGDEADTSGNELNCHTITVRGSGIGAGTGEIKLTSEQLIEMAHKIIKRYT